MLQEKIDTILKESPLKHLNLLAVDDDISSTKIISVYFGAYCKDLVIKNSSEEALDLFKRREFDIVISDISMPKLDGINLCKKLKEINPNINIILTSNFTDSTYLFEAIKIGIKNYLPKPLNFTELGLELDKIAKTLYNQKMVIHSKRLLEQYKFAIDTSTILSKTDAKGVITYVNDKFCEISGYSYNELIGKPHSLIRHPDMSSEAFKELWATIKNKEVWRGVVKNRKKDGSFYIVDATIIPILDEFENPVEYIAVRHDITELESYKELLKNQLDSSKNSLEEKMHFLGEYERAIDEGSALCRTSIDKIITYANSKFAEILGYSQSELVGKNYYDISDKEFFHNNQEVVESKIHYKDIWSGVFKHKRKDGSICYTNSKFIPILSLENEVVEVMRFHNDISEIVALNKEIEDTQKEIILTLGSIGEMRSKETANHVNRVAKYSYILGRGYGLEEHDIELLKLAAPMHDIGKVGIADSILNKPGKLNDDEFNTMKTHSKLGYDMLKGSNREILKSAATIALEHHERWDGKGYPDGKKGDEIHIFGRIVAVADVYDALGSDRCYKKAWERDRIFELLKSERGSAFEPKLIDIFFENIDEIEEIKRKYKD